MQQHGKEIRSTNSFWNSLFSPDLLPNQGACVSACVHWTDSCSPITREVYSDPEGGNLGGSGAIFSPSHSSEHDKAPHVVRTLA